MLSKCRETVAWPTKFSLIDVFLTGPILESVVATAPWCRNGLPANRLRQLAFGLLDFRRQGGLKRMLPPFRPTLLVQIALYYFVF